MTRYIKTLSYLFAAMAGVCFVSGLAFIMMTIKGEDNEPDNS